MQPNSKVIGIGCQLVIIPLQRKYILKKHFMSTMNCKDNFLNLSVFALKGYLFTIITEH